MRSSVETSTVEQVVKSQVHTVNPKDKIEDVAKMFEQNDINAAPVVDSFDNCVGIITSHDLVEYEAMRIEMENQSLHGIAYDIAHIDDDRPLSISGRPFDEVDYHMSRDVATTEFKAPLIDASRLMCRNHLHHLVVLDDVKRPVGILSSLDILGHVIGEPVTRKDHAKTDEIHEPEDGH